MSVSVPTTPFDDQLPGTSGLRKKVVRFQEQHYLENFVQATFDALAQLELTPKTLVVGGDGRYLSDVACQTIVKMAAANGVQHVLVGHNSLLSTPAVSATVRTHAAKPEGAFILTASHNPGGPENDFGIKYNMGNGGPAPEKVTGVIIAKTKAIQAFNINRAIPDIALGTPAEHAFGDFRVTVIDSVDTYAQVLRKVFDFEAIRRLIARPDFTFVYDAMHGVAGPQARRILVEELGAPESVLLNAVPTTDFGGGHPDPNLTYAEELVRIMGLQRDGTVRPDAEGTPCFGAAADGDADRNMILGSKFFVTPSDSVAVIAANAACIPFFKDGLKAVARSMPTSGALDRVAAKLGVRCFEVPTGWKFFGNLMDSAVAYGKTEYNPLICGEESFGTGSNHVREKDGLWAVLCWLQILAAKNTDATKPLVTVEDIVTAHWREFGRNYYCRYDYEGVESDAAAKLMEHMRALPKADVPPLGDTALDFNDDFCYTDPVDGSVSAKQGIRVVYKDGSRFVFRLSGTGSAGATIRLYIEQYMPPAAVAAKLPALPPTAEVLAPLVRLALETSKLEAFTGRSEPTVIT